MFDLRLVPIVAAGLLLSGLLAPGPPAGGAAADRPVYIVQLEGAADPSRLQEVDQRQGRFLAAAAAELGRPLAPRFRYRAAFNGVALALSEDERSKLARLPGVVGIHPNRPARLASDAGPAWIGAGGIWDGSQTGGLPGTMGEGVVIGVIDTPVDPQHPSFADVGADGYDHINPRGAGNYLGWCDPAHPRYDPSLACNDKLIGIWFPESCAGSPAPRGHGSHVASVAAGNHVTAATLDFPTGSISRDISGVAPHANLAVYSGCSETLWHDALLAAVDQAVLDGVDVLNFSVVGGSSSVQPWDSPLALALLGAREAGIFVSVPAGRAWDGIPSVSTSPWTVTVGATTHDRSLENVLTDLSGGDAPPPDLEGTAWSGPYGPAPIVHADSFGASTCASPFPAGTFSGEIVVCEHLDFIFTPPIAQGENVLAGGAGGVVLAANFWEPSSLLAEDHVLPAVHLRLPEADLLRAWLAAGTGHAAKIAGTAAVSEPQNGDIVASSSARGPASQVPGVLKPDLVAPGVDVFGAWTGSDDYEVLSGTSASVAFTSGAAALLLALHPDWTPGEVHSALATTAATGLVDEIDGTPADPFDRGSGRIDLAAAGRAGLLLDETAADFADADPVLGGDPSALNLPALACRQDQQCRWTRVVRNALATPAAWNASWTAPPGVSLTVTPSSFDLGPGAAQAIEVVADAVSPPPGLGYGELVLTETGEQAPPARLPIAIQWVPRYQLEVVREGGGEGSVTSGPPGIDCGDDCSEAFLSGEAVTLTATPAPGSLFLGWNFVSGCFENPECMVHLFSDQTFTAYFAPVPPDVQLADGQLHGDLLDPPQTSFWKYYYVDVVAGATPLIVDLFLAGGDATLYLRFGDKPTWSQYDCLDLGSDTPESRRCTVTRTQAGRWWIGVVSAWEETTPYSVRARWETTGTHFFTLTPCRLLDTRDTSDPLQSGVPRTVETFSPCGIPPYAVALSANVTVVAPTAIGRFTFYSGDGPPPGTSTLNFQAGQVRANNAILVLDPLTATFKALATLVGGGEAHLLVDVNGYFR